MSDITKELIEEQKGFAKNLAEAINELTGTDDEEGADAVLLLDALAVCGYQILPCVSGNIASLAMFSILGASDKKLDEEGWEGTK